MKRLGFVFVLMLAIVSLLVIGCGGDGEEEATPTPAATPEVTATPTPTATPEATPTPTPRATPGEAPTPTEPVSFNDLIPFLPDAPSGWEADDAFGMTQTFQEWSWSQASRSFINTTTDEYVVVVIFDSAYYYGFGWWGAWEYAFEWESTEGYARSITFEGYPAWEMYNKPDSYSLMVFVGDRFMVMIDAETEASLNQFAGLVNYGGIAGLR